MHESFANLWKHVLPVAADAVSFLLYVWILPRLTLRLQEKSLANAALFAAVYLIFCLSVYLIRKFNFGPAVDVDPSFVRAVLAFLAACFSVFFTVMLADSSGLGDWLNSVGPGLDTLGKNLAVLLGVLIWLAVVFLYPALVWLDIPSRLSDQSLHAHLLRLLGLFGTNLMIVFSIAHWEAYFADVEASETLALGGRLLVFVLVYVFFLFFYASPRLLYLMGSPTIIGLISFFLQTGYYVWNLLEGKAWQSP